MCLLLFGVPDGVSPVLISSSCEGSGGLGFPYPSPIRDSIDVTQLPPNRGIYKNTPAHEQTPARKFLSHVAGVQTLPSLPSQNTCSFAYVSSSWTSFLVVRAQNRSGTVGRHTGAPDEVSFLYLNQTAKVTIVTLHWSN